MRTYLIHLLGGLDPEELSLSYDFKYQLKRVELARKENELESARLAKLHRSFSCPRCKYQA